MNSNELKNIIENARIAKEISQRELAKLSGISRSTLNDIINGKIKKVDPLGITDLRVRGMWSIFHPVRVFDYLPKMDLKLMH